MWLEMGGQLRKGLRRFKPGNPQTPEAVDESFDWKRPKKRLLKKKLATNKVRKEVTTARAGEAAL